jgi:hypothetical protein
LSKKFDQMSLEEIEDYIKERIKNEWWRNK